MGLNQESNCESKWPNWYWIVEFLKDRESVLLGPTRSNPVKKKEKDFVTRARLEPLGPDDKLNIITVHCWLLDVSDLWM